MSRPRSLDSGHLDAAAALDYVDGHAAADLRRAVEEHLALPCPACRERVRELGWLRERMARDRVPQVPAALRARALAVFDAREPRKAIARAVAALARPLFDSLTQPLPAPARAVGEARRLAFGLGDHRIEFEAEIETATTRTLRGRLQVPDPALHRIEVTAMRERLVAVPDARGWFSLERVPAGRVRIAVRGPAGPYRLPLLDL
jgi:anti-sigma factor RsiW